MKDKKIIVIMGGPSKEADVSRRTAGAICKALQEKGYVAETLELNPTTVLDDIKAMKGDIVFNALHGKFGEDGALQGLLEISGIPYTGSGIAACAVSMNKKISKQILESEGISTARTSYFDYRWMTQEEVLAEIAKNFTYPVVVKAASQGSSIGVYIVHTKEELETALEDVKVFDTQFIVEQFLSGGEFTVGVLNGKALPVVKIEPHSGAYDYTSKYTTGATEYLCPAPISKELTEEMQRLAERTYAAFSCEGVARVDIMTDTVGKPYVLELNSIPGMTETSLVPKEAKAMGMDFASLCEAILESAGLDKH